MSDGSNVDFSAEQHQNAIIDAGSTPCRSASPAKRTAADMEGEGQHIPGSFVKESQEGGPSHFDESMKDVVSQDGDQPVDEVMESQDITPRNAPLSGQDNTASGTSTTGLASNLPPAYSAIDAEEPTRRTNEMLSIDEQVRKVYQLVQNPKLDEGERGYLVSSRWIQRVFSRSSEGLKNSKFPKELREGDIGPIDNSDIVPEGAFIEPILQDSFKQPFIPIKPSLALDEDFQILPYEAWGLVVGWYGNTLGQKPVVRYVHNTAPPDAAYPNFQYELEPPVITVRRIPQPHADEESESSSGFSKSSAAALRQQEEERQARGQLSPNDAVQLVSSKAERFNDFLKRAKQATGIPYAHKVKTWRLLQPATSFDDKPDEQMNGTPAHPEPSSASPRGARAPQSLLILDPEQWSKMEGGRDFELINEKDDTNNSNFNGRSTMAVYGLYDNATIALEEMITGPGGGEYPSDSKKMSAKLGPTKRILGSKPGSAAASGRTSPAPSSGGVLTRGRARRDGRTRGTVGLSNLGNTCYMNSALQCIRSVEELAVFFLSGKYKSEINTNNPLGHKGAMAKRYAELLESMYSDNATGSITPQNFRRTLGSIQPMFSSYGQQDSQEFLSFLVDALHEDLNRIQKKPYNENPDSDDKTVHDPQAIIKLGETYRANHRARNDSVAMDLFSGFYKNTMECPVCDKISITFDPYSLLTVQLPIESTFQHDVTFVPLRGTPVNHAIDIDKHASIKTLKEYIASKHPDTQADRLWMVEVYSHKIYKVFENSATLSESNIQASDCLFMFELDAVPSNPMPAAEKKYMFSSKSESVPNMDDARADHFVVPVFSRQKNRSGYNWEHILHPVYVILTREEAQDSEVILKKVLIALSRLTSKPILTEQHVHGNDNDSNVEMKDDSAGEDNAQITEHSASSEDGYVEVSLDRPEEISTPAVQTNGASQTENEDREGPVPPHFMNPQYFVSPDLRDNLFVLNYGQSEGGGLHCSGMHSFKDGSVKNLFDRVKPSARRSSTQSSSSDEASTTSTASGALANGGESEESDVDKPDIVLGGTQESSGGVSIGVAELSDDELPDDPLRIPMSRKGRRKNNKHGKKNRKLQTYSTKSQRGQRQKDNPSALVPAQSYGKLMGRAQDEESNPYYIKLGEGIVLDWHPQAVNKLFSGDPSNAEDDRGHFVSSQDGKNLPYAHDPEVEAKKERREARKKHGITLNDCFVETGKRETLSEDNAWYCSRCKELRRARKTLEIWTIPDILVVHLKRFGGNRSFRDKIDVFVDYPINGLDMTERVGLKEEGKGYIYDLFAVDNHYGGLGGGHYTALAKNFYDGQWYDYNDSSCSKVNADNRLHSAAAYLLFYRRRSETPLGPQYLQDMVTEARNPHAPSTDEAAEESDSGEGQLGGPTYSLLGSPSDLAGAGVDPASLHSGESGSVGMGARVSNNPTTKTTSPLESTTGAQAFGNQGASWSFQNLDGNTAEQPAETLMSTVDDGNQDDDDAASTTAMLDDDYTERIEQSFSVFSAAAPPGSISSDFGSDEQDQRDLFLDDRTGSLHLHDAGTMGQEMDEDSGPVDIYPSSPGHFELEHDKMD